MDEPDTKTAPSAQPETKPVPRYEFITIMIAIVGMGIALGTLLLNNTDRLDSAIAQAAADRRAFQAEAAADRRAADAKMDEFRRQMRRLGERQARLEGQREADTQQ